MRRTSRRAAVRVHLQDQIDQGARALGVELPAVARDKLLAYLRLLEKWNRSYNLTAVRGLEQMVPRHLLDSLAVARFVAGPHVLDIGSGAGLPGIPLACARPELLVTLLDSNAKKTRFLHQVVAELALANVSVVNARVEQFHPPEQFVTLLARAWTGIPDMLNRCRHLLTHGGRLLALKGAYPKDELAALPDAYAWQVERLAVPGLDAERHLVIITIR
jgi:16S rRNA (guanine527-N7)-methyltransferase